MHPLVEFFLVIFKSLKKILHHFISSDDRASKLSMMDMDGWMEGWIALQTSRLWQNLEMVEVLFVLYTTILCKFFNVTAQLLLLKTK